MTNSYFFNDLIVLSVDVNYLILAEAVSPSFGVGITKRVLGSLLVVSFAAMSETGQQRCLVVE